MRHVKCCAFNTSPEVHISAPDIWSDLRNRDTSFIFLWSGQQYIPGFAGFEKYGLIYAIVCLVGAICNFAILRGYGWGVIGQLIVWGANSVVNIILHRDIEPYFGLALLLIGFWVFDVYRNRRLLG